MPHLLSAICSLQGFPTIIFFPAEKGAEPVPFDSGDRSLASLTKFIKQHAKVGGGGGLPNTTCLSH